MKTAEITQESVDEHVFVIINCPDRPTVSIDITDHHGRRGLSVRIDGMGVGEFLVDLKELPAIAGKLFRYCGMCGEKLNLHSSRAHQCALTEIETGKEEL
jgi:hypothetical protein